MYAGHRTRQRGDVSVTETKDGAKKSLAATIKIERHVELIHALGRFRIAIRNEANYLP